MAPPQILVGPRVTLYINGTAFGRVSGFQWTSTVVQKAIHALDSLAAYELAPGQAKVMGTVQVYRLAGDGGAEGAQITTQFQDLVRQNYFTVALVQRDNEAILFSANKCALVSQSWNAPTKGFITGSINFEALDWENEVAPSPA
jgi:hypothetical protein